MTATDPTTHTAPMATGCPEEATVRRAQSGHRGATEASAPAPSQGQVGRPSRALLGGLAVVVLVLLGVVTYLALRPPRAEAPIPTPIPTVSMPGDDSAIPDAVFEPPTLSADPVPGGVVFRWSYPQPSARDAFRLFTGATAAAAARGAGPRSVTTRTHTVKSGQGTTVCALVQVDRAGAASPTSEPQCETAR